MTGRTDTHGAVRSNADFAFAELYDRRYRSGQD